MTRCTIFVTLFIFVSCNPKKNGSSQSDESPKTAEQQSTEEELVNKDTTSFDLGNFQQLVEKYEDPQRADWQNPELIIETLGDLTNETVADIGAGTGYFTFRMAEKGAKVIAIDIDSHFLDYIEERKADLENSMATDKIETRLVPEDDPLLKPHEADIALLVNTYHFLEDRSEYLKKIAAGLKKDGKLIIVDYKEGNLPVGPSNEYKIPLARAKQEIENAGLKILEVDSKSLNYQYIITAKP